MRTSICSNGHRSAALIAALLMTFIMPVVGLAQDSVVVISSTPYVEPAEMLARLKNEGRAAGITAAFKKGWPANNGTVFQGNYDRYTDTERRQILDEVERIAQGVGGDAATAERAEISAYAVLADLGRDTELSQAYGIPDRLLRIYANTKNDDIKRRSVRGLGRILRNSPTASPRIVELLVSLVTQTVTLRRNGYHGMMPVFEEPVHPDDALDALLRACEAGVPVLRQLAANRGAIKHDVVRARVDSLAREGFAPGRMRLSSTGRNPCTAG